MASTHSFARASVMAALAVASMAGCGGGPGEYERDAPVAVAGAPADAAAASQATAAPAPADAVRQPFPAEGSQSAQPWTPDIGKRVTALQSEVAQLRQQVSALESALGGSGRPLRAAAGPESRFASEAAGSQWSQIARAQVTAAFARITTETDAANPLRTIECRASMCRIETTPEAEEAVSENLSAVIGALRGTFSEVFAVPVAESAGRPASVIYFSR